MRGMRLRRFYVRHGAHAAVLRVYPLVGFCRFPGVLHASDKLPDMRHKDRAGALGRRQEPMLQCLPVVSCPVGTAAFMERGGTDIRDDMERSVPVGSLGR